MNWLPRFLSIIIFGLSSYVYAGGDEKAIKLMIDQFAAIRNDLTQVISAPPVCTSTLPDYSKNDCKMNALCKTFETQADTGTFYQNANGKQIVDTDLFSVEVKLKACYDQKVASHHWDTHRNEKANQRTVALLKAESDFLKSIQKNNEGAIRIKLDLAINQLLIESLLVASPDNTTGSEAQLRKIEKIAGVRFSLETRKLYLTYLSLKDAKDEENGRVESSAGTSATDLAATKVAPNSARFRPFDWKMLHHPFLNISALYDIQAAGSKAQLQENQKNYQKSLDQTFQIFKDTQKSLIAHLRKTQTAANHDQIENMIQRVSTVQMKATLLSADNPTVTTGTCKSPNAFYTAATHTLTVCPQYLLYPEMSIRKSLAHELGHSIDPCRMTDSLIAIDNAEPKIAAMAHVTPKKKAALDLDMMPYTPTLPELPSKTRYKVNTPGVVEANLKSVYEHYDSKTVAESVPLAQYPFKSAVDCFSSKESVELKVPNTEELAQDLDASLHGLEERGASPDSPELRALYQAKKDLPLFRERIVCKSVPNGHNHSKMNETMADYFAAKVLNQYLADAEPAQRKQLAFESVGSFLTKCRTSTNWKFKEKAQKILHDLGCNPIAALDFFSKDIQVFQSVIEQMGDEHLSTQMRVDKIFLKEPQFQAALGCSAMPGVKYCE
jgi:hypothetical protein